MYVCTYLIKHKMLNTYVIITYCIHIFIFVFMDKKINKK